MTPAATALIATLRSQLDTVTAERDRWRVRAESLVKLLDNTTIPGVARRLVKLLDDRGHTPKFDSEIRVELDDLRLMVGPLW